MIVLLRHLSCQGEFIGVKMPRQKTGAQPHNDSPQKPLILYQANDLCHSLSVLQHMFSLPLIIPPGNRPAAKSTRQRSTLVRAPTSVVGWSGLN